MTLPAPATAAYPTPNELRDQWLADVRYGYAARGVTANVEPGSELYVRATAVAARVAVAIANNQIALIDSNPLTAEGDALDSLAGVFGVTRRPASYATGLVAVTTQKLTATTWATVGIPQSFRCTLANGLSYETTTNSAAVTNGDVVEVRAVSAGVDSNADAADIGNWDSAAIGFLDTRVTVDSGGIDGGADADDDDALRTRLIRKLSRPAVGGNSAHVQELAEGASAAIQAAFVYQAAQGPASYDVAIVRSDENRTLNSSVQATAAAAVLANMPGNATLNLTSVTGQEVNVVATIKLPLPVNAGGSGGGWYDASPWPSTADTGSVPRGLITSIADLLTLSQITVNSTSDDVPPVGARIAIWDNDTATFGHFTIAARSGVSEAYVLTLSVSLSSSLTFIETNMVCSPDAVHMDDYGAALHTAMLSLGPGEKTAQAEYLPRARRTPTTEESFPADARIPMMRALTSFQEITGIATIFRETNWTTERYVPSVPATTTLPPRILVPKNLAFRREV